MAAAEGDAEGGMEEEPQRPEQRPDADSDDEDSPREEDDPDRPPKPKTQEDKIYDKIDEHVEKIEGHDAILAQAQKELAAEIERGRAKKRKVQEKYEREEQLRKEAAERAVAQAKANRRRRAKVKEDRVAAKEQRKRDEYARAVWAATRIQSGYRGRRDRIYGNRRRVVVLGRSPFFESIFGLAPNTSKRTAAAIKRNSSQ